jgi:3-oxoacyl-[acyl-carrier protein] reductase
MRLDGKTALVTGAGSGIGKCIAETYAREGARVALADIELAAAQTAARAIGNNAIAVRCNVSKKADFAAAVAETLSAFGALDILVNNAGATHVNKPMLDIDEAEYDRIFAVNVKGVFLGCQAVVPVFRKQGGGVIINIGSTAGLRPRPGLSAYNATKGAVHILTKSLAVELGPGRGPAREVYRDRAARPFGAAAGYRQCGAVSRLPRGRIRHRQHRRSGWRADDLGRDQL